MEDVPRKKGLPKVVSVVIVVLVAALAAGGSYYFVNNKAETEKNDLKTQISDLQKQLVAAKTAETTIPVAPVTTTSSPQLSTVTVTTAEAITKVEALQAVKDFYASVSKSGSEIDTEKTSSTYWAVHVYETLTDGKSTFNWYSVDKTTGVVKEL